jgi:hypothetical protein
MRMSILQSPKHYQHLERVDKDIAAGYAFRPCDKCPATHRTPGTLHRSDYERKPRGFAPGGEPAKCMRESFCCSAEGCRKRTTPPSVRFLGRRVYLGVVVALVAAMRHGPNPVRMKVLEEHLGVDRSTVARWCRWWREGFVDMPFWRELRRTFLPRPDEERLPRSLWERYGCTRAGMIEMFEALGPVTTATGREGR